LSSSQRRSASAALISSSTMPLGSVWFAVGLGCGWFAVGLVCGWFAKCGRGPGEGLRCWWVVKGPVRAVGVPGAGLGSRGHLQERGEPSAGPCTLLLVRVCGRVAPQPQGAQPPPAAVNQALVVPLVFQQDDLCANLGGGRGGGAGRRHVEQKRWAEDWLQRLRRR
jgi:hypothetical protein